MDELKDCHANSVTIEIADIMSCYFSVNLLEKILRQYKYIANFSIEISLRVRECRAVGKKEPQQELRQMKYV